MSAGTPSPRITTGPGRSAGTARLLRNTALGLVGSVVLAGVKFLAGVVGNSSALIADAVESLADTIGSILVWQSLRVGDRPPDERHPYGYGKAEALGALAVGLLLFAAAGVIAVKAVRDMLIEHDAPEWWTLLVLLCVLVAKETLFRVVMRDARRLESDVAKNDAWHHRADAVTSAAAFVGVAVAIWGPGLTGMRWLVLADEAAAIVASGLILFTGVSLMRGPWAELLDAHAPVLSEKVRSVASNVEGVRFVEKVRARKSGRGYLVDLHLQVAPEMNVRDAHALGGRTKAVILEKNPEVLQVLVHVEPFEGSVPTGVSVDV